MKFIVGSAFYFFLIFYGSAFAQSPKIDSLLTELPNEIGDTRFMILGSLYCEISPYDIEKAKKYLDLRQKDALMLRDSFKISENYLVYGEIFIDQGKFEEAEKILFKALGVVQRNKYDRKIKLIFNQLAIMYERMGDYDKALDYHFKSLRSRISDGSSVEISVAYNNIGWTYENLRDYERALEFYNKTYFLKKKENISWGMIIALVNKSNIHNILGEYDSGFLYAKQAIDFCKSNCTPSDMYEARMGIGKSYLVQNSADSALIHFSKALEIANGIKSNRLVIEPLIYLAKANFSKKQLTACLDYLERANFLLQTNYSLAHELLIYKTYSDVYKELGNYQLVAEYLQRQSQLESKLYSGSIIKNVAEASVSAIDNNRKVTIDTQKELLTLKENAIAQQRVITIISVVLLVLLVLVALMLWYAIRTKGRINHILNKRVKERTRELNLRNDELNRLTLEQTTILEKLNQQVRAFTVTLSGLMHVAEKDVQDPLAIAYLRKLDKEISKMKNKTSLFLKPEAVTNKTSPKEELSV